MIEVWVVGDDHMGIERIYSDEAKAREFFKERVRYYEGHDKPSDHDHWTYKLFQYASSNIVLFDAYLRGEWRKVIGVYYSKMEVL